MLSLYEALSYNNEDYIQEGFFDRFRKKSRWERLKDFANRHKTAFKLGAFGLGAAGAYTGISARNYSNMKKRFAKEAQKYGVKQDPNDKNKYIGPTGRTATFKGWNPLNGFYGDKDINSSNFDKYLELRDENGRRYTQKDAEHERQVINNILQQYGG